MFEQEGPVIVVIPSTKQFTVFLVTYFVLTIAMMAVIPESTGTILRSVVSAYIMVPILRALYFLWVRKFTKQGISFLVDLFLVILPKYFFIPFGVWFLLTGISAESPYLQPVFMGCTIVQKIVGGGLEALGHGIYSLFHGGRWDLWLICMIVELAIGRALKAPQKKEDERAEFAKYKAWRAADVHVHNDRIRAVSDDEYLQITKGEPKQLPKRSTAGNMYV